MLYFSIYSRITLCANDSTLSKINIPFDTSKIEVRRLNNIEQEKLLNDKDYKYDKDIGPAPITAWDKFLDWLYRKFSHASNTKAGSYSINVLQLILLAGAIILTIFLLLKNDIRFLFYGKSASVSIDFKEFDDDINKINFDELIAQAIAQTDFRKAIRLHFLKLLKELTDKNLIKWKIDKTNKDYSIELNNSKYNAHFKELVSLYEYVWYGDFPMEEAHFEETRIKFNKFGN